jgi:hypothetical protein
MACEGFEKRLIEKALAETDPALTAHLAKCADCREEFAAQRELQERITNGIAAMVVDEPSPALLTRVRARIDEPDSPRSINWVQWVATGAAVAAFAAVAVWMIGRPTSRLSVPANVPSQSAKNSSAPPAVVAQPVDSERPAPANLTVVREHRPMRRVPHPVSPVIAPVTVEMSQPNVALAANHPPAEIIVPAGQREAVLRLVNALRTGRVDAASLIRATQPGEVAPLAITPLEVKPLNGGGGSEDEFDIEF